VISTTEPGTYVALELDAATRAQLDRFVTDQLKLAQPIDPEYYHITVIYSRTPVAQADLLPEQYQASATGIRYALWTTRDARQCLVMLVESYQARYLNQQLTQLGAVSDYNQYTPHLTLSYDYTGPNITQLPLPQFPIVLDRLLVKELDTNFVPPTKSERTG
jgi:2'-5' RNA ligase